MSDERRERHRQLWEDDLTFRMAMRFWLHLRGWRVVSRKNYFTHHWKAKRGRNAR